MVCKICRLIFVYVVVFTHLFSCRSRDLPFYLGIVVPFLVCTTATTVILGITFVLLVRVSLQSVFSVKFLGPLATAVLFTLGSTFTLAKANASASAATGMELLFLLTGGLLGFYVFLFYCIASSDIRKVWKETVTNIPQFERFLESFSRKPKAKATQSPYKKEEINDSDVELKPTTSTSTSELKLQSVSGSTSIDV